MKLSLSVTQGLPALALYQPDIAQNLGAVIRLCACSGMALHVVEPCGFPMDDARIKRVGMDYVAHVQLIRHRSWDEFSHVVSTQHHRLMLLTTKATDSYTSITYGPKDILLFGRESSGAPQEVHDAAHTRVTIPMPGGGRSLNLAMSAAMVTGEVIRQLA